jgi:hypothetical protein
MSSTRNWMRGHDVESRTIIAIGLLDKFCWNPAAIPDDLAWVVATWGDLPAAVKPMSYH